MLRSKLLTAAVIAVLSVGTLQAQETATIKEAVESVGTSEVVSNDTPSATSVALDQEGQLIGSVFVAGDERSPLEAKVTLANSDGVVVDTVVAEEDGSFAFTSVAPGSYNMYGSSASYVGAQAIDVVPHSTGGCSACNLAMNTYSTDTYETYAQAPVSSCGSCSAAPTCGCGGGSRGLFGGGGGGFLGGGGGGGLLGGSRFLRFAALGGVVAIATSGGDDDASPDN